MQVRNSRSVFTVALIVLALTAGILSSCAATPSDGCNGSPPVSTPYSWAAFGDSIFAGSGLCIGAPAYMPGVKNLAIPGNTLVGVNLLGTNQQTVLTQIKKAAARGDIPADVIVDAGQADMIVRASFGTAALSDKPGKLVNTLTLSDYISAMQQIDTYLTDMGVNVHWTTITPIGQGAPAWTQNFLRMQINAMMTTVFSGRVTSCETQLTGGGTWMLKQFWISSQDGEHMNPLGATVYANCLMANGLGITVPPETTTTEPPSTTMEPPTTEAPPTTEEPTTTEAPSTTMEPTTTVTTTTEAPPGEPTTTVPDPDQEVTTTTNPV